MGEGVEQTAQTSVSDDATRRWTEWSIANYPADVAERVSAAAIEALRSGGSDDAAYQAAIRAAERTSRDDTKQDSSSGATQQPLVAELFHGSGSLGLSADGTALVLRTHGKNAVTRKEWHKEEPLPLTSIDRILAVSRDRSSFGLEIYYRQGKSLFEVGGITPKGSLDATLQAVHASAPQIPIDLAHPSHGIPDPVPDEIKKQRKSAESFNKDELTARANSGRQEVKVKNYDNGKDYARDAPSMAKQGWSPQGETAGRGKVSVGGTAGKLVLTGGLGAITGLSHKGSKITVTWVRQLPFHQARELLPVPTVPEPRTFPAEPYFTATNLAPVLPGAEYPVFGPTVTLSCFKCHADVEVAASATDYRCSACGEHLYMRSCPHCPKTLVLGEALYGRPIKCLSCQQTSNWKQIDNRRVTADHSPGRKLPAVVAPLPQVTAPTPATQSTSPALYADKPSIPTRMKDLSELHDAGLINDDEFAAKRTALIAEL